MPHRRLVVLAAAVSVSAVTLGSGIARADDMGYLRQLEAVNIPSDSPYEVLIMGHDVCAGFASGRTASAIEQAIMTKGRATDEPAWSKSQADWLIAAAVVNLCPQMQGAPSSSPQP
jgi:hypothetical protein